MTPAQRAAEIAAAEADEERIAAPHRRALARAEAAAAELAAALEGLAALGERPREADARFQNAFLRGLQGAVGQPLSEPYENAFARRVSALRVSLVRFREEVETRQRTFARPRGRPADPTFAHVGAVLHAFGLSHDEVAAAMRRLGLEAHASGGLVRDRLRKKRVGRASVGGRK